MDTSFLTISELKYECAIRGIEFSKHDNGKTSLVFLRALLQKEYLQVTDQPKSSKQYNQAEELEYCGQLIQELAQIYRTSGKSEALNSRLLHLVARFQRINDKEVEHSRYTEVHQSVDIFLKLMNITNLDSFPINTDQNGKGENGDNLSGSSGSPNKTLIENPQQQSQDKNNMSLDLVKASQGSTIGFASGFQQYRPVNLHSLTNPSSGVQNINPYLGTTPKPLFVPQKPEVNGERQFLGQSNSESIQNRPRYDLPMSDNAELDFYKQQVQQLSETVRQLSLKLDSVTQHQANTNQSEFSYGFNSINSRPNQSSMPNQSSLRQTNFVPQPQRNDQGFRQYGQRSYNSVKHWNLLYTGDKNSMCLDEFITLAEIYAEAQGLSKADLFSSTIFLLGGSARQAYMSVRRSVPDWDSLVSYLKRTFVLGGYQFSLRKRIEQTLQERNEPVGSFIAKMKIMFESLYPPMSEAEKILAVKRNMMIDISQLLFPFQINDLFELEEACYRIEKNLHETGYKPRVPENKPTHAYKSGPQVHEIQAEITGSGRFTDLAPDHETEGANTVPHVDAISGTNY